MKVAFAFLALAGALLLLSRGAPAAPIGMVVDNGADGIIVTVNTEAANVHFSYDQSCADNKPCYSITAGQGMVGIPVTATGCTAKQGSDSTPSAVQCPPGAGSVQFKMAGGGTWSAYAGGGGEHAGTSCSPARVVIITGAGANSINSWDGCHEVIQCNSVSGSFTGIEADASDDVTGKCSSVVKH